MMQYHNRGIVQAIAAGILIFTGLVEMVREHTALIFTSLDLHVGCRGLQPRGRAQSEKHEKAYFYGLCSADWVRHHDSAG